MGRESQGLVSKLSEVWERRPVLRHPLEQHLDVRTPVVPWDLVKMQVLMQWIRVKPDTVSNKLPGDWRSWSLELWERPGA